MLIAGKYHSQDVNPSEAGGEIFRKNAFNIEKNLYKADLTCFNNVKLFDMFKCSKFNLLWFYKINKFAASLGMVEEEELAKILIILEKNNNIINNIFVCI